MSAIPAYGRRAQALFNECLDELAASLPRAMSAAAKAGRTREEMVALARSAVEAHRRVWAPRFGRLLRSERAAAVRSRGPFGGA